jgi:uncharacterized protein (DUF1499 family)
MSLVVLLSALSAGVSIELSVRSAIASCRAGLAGGALVACALAGAPHAASAVAQCTDESNPSYTVRHCRNFGLQSDGRLVRCAANSNCISTGSVASPQHFSPPWSFKSAGNVGKLSERDVRVAWNLLNDALASTDGLKVVERNEELLYLRAESASSVPPTSTDDVEFVLSRAEGTVTYHSESRDTLFVYPLQRPVGCNDCHKKRLEALRRRLGWDDLSEQFNYDLSEGSGDLDDLPGRGSSGFTLGRFVPLL